MSIFNEWTVDTFQEVSRALRTLGGVLRQLTFADNFESFEVDVTISATSEVTILNQLGFIPSRYVVFSMEGDGSVRKGATEWTSAIVTLRNPDASDVTAKVGFFR